MRRSATLVLITSARWKMSSNVNRFLVYNPVCNGIHSDEVTSMPCKEVLIEKGLDEPKQPCQQVPKEEKVRLNLLKYTRIFPRWCSRLFQRKNLGTSLDKNDMMGQGKSD